MPENIGANIFRTAFPVLDFLGVRPFGDAGALPAGPPSAQKGAKTWEQRLMEFFDEMNKPLDLDDPEIQAILGTARTQSQNDAAARGVNGAASVRVGEDSYLRAAAGLRGERQGMAMNALGMGAGLEQRNRDRAYDDMWRRYEFDASRRTGMGQTVGAGLGALAGSFFGAPGVGAQIGAGIGGGLNSAGIRPPPSYGSYGGGY